MSTPLKPPEREGVPRGGVFRLALREGVDYFSVRPERLSCQRPAALFRTPPMTSAVFLVLKLYSQIVIVATSMSFGRRRRVDVSATSAFAQSAPTGLTRWVPAVARRRPMRETEPAE